MKKSINSSKGITLFIAVTIMGILLFISFAVVNISIKSTLFASAGRDSQLAFYAADAGLDCAIYWDSKFEPSKFSVSGSSISCGGVTIEQDDPILGTTTATIMAAGGPVYYSVFGFKLDHGQNPVEACTIVTVTKNLSGQTYIKSRGYNTCDINNSRRIERGVEVTY